MNRFSFLLFFALFALSICDDTAVPSTFICPSSGNFANPDECDQYINCQQQDDGTYIATLNSCPAPLGWSDDLQGCTAGDCQNPFPTCPGYWDVIPHQYDCRSYYQCIWGRPHVQWCPYGTLFSDDVNQCLHAAQVQCDTSKLCYVTPTASYTFLETPSQIIDCSDSAYTAILLPYDSTGTSFAFCIDQRPVVMYCCGGYVVEVGSNGVCVPRPPPE